MLVMEFMMRAPNQNKNDKKEKKNLNKKDKKMNNKITHEI